MEELRPLLAILGLVVAGVGLVAVDRARARPALRVVGTALLARPAAKAGARRRGAGRRAFGPRSAGERRRAAVVFGVAFTAVRRGWIGTGRGGGARRPDPTARP